MGGDVTKSFTYDGDGVLRSITAAGVTTLIPYDDYRIVGSTPTVFYRFQGRTVALIGQQKGRDIDERAWRNFGMPHPEGYRKGMRIMEIAQRHQFPLVTFLDSPGAYPGVAAEQHGQGGAIARSQALMARLTVPIVTCIIGEGNSGGAIAIGLVDRVLRRCSRGAVDLPHEPTDAVRSSPIGHVRGEPTDRR